MANVLRALAFLAIIDLARYAAGWPANACMQSCTTMQVNHYFDHDYDPNHYNGTPPPHYPSTPGDGGFYLSINASRYENGTAKNGTPLYTPGKTYNITLRGNRTFRGFIVRPSLSPFNVSDELSEGTGLVNDSAANHPVQMQCQDQAVCHTKVYEKKAIWFLWHAPAENYTCIYFHFTVLVNYTIYYVDMIFEVCGDPTPPPTLTSSRATVLSTVRSATYDSVPASVSLSTSSTSGLATRRITPSPHTIGTGQPTSIAPPPYNDKLNPGGGALAGIIIGCCLAFVACLAVGIQIYQRKISKREYNLAEETDTLTMFHINENVQSLSSSDETPMASSDELMQRLV
ncbi:uncharacterized protein [Oscarella lobularis]|uniref:uncharacterized protein isoform X3 n=1 Tax=Oscarella lobularis TaxID=121494 RepID=UPI003313B9D0